ncbi:SRA stem-loop-interacting RNA-binding protein, mitochondrial [Eublepharis macularius]|uniref:SRA stem-loop-interacting RNA-binding protein, mitochondrial n=1 Tax=Eublepharis macularius TaxID=481883 RepID=A0AA97IVP7_EUBMA|nr:SRA stem-loop-interacting RNA-binding protein, mitochondrial [Eublepharis macularius]
MAAVGASRRVFELFVTRVPWTASANEVREYFGQFGTVRKCILPFDKETGFHKGLCWVGFSTEEGLNNALQKETHILEGVKIEVKQQQSRSFLQQHSLRTTADNS